MIELDTAQLLGSYATCTALTTFNVGYTNRKPKLRDLSSFIPLHAYQGPLSRIREVTIEASIPGLRNYITRVTLLKSGTAQTLFTR